MKVTSHEFAKKLLKFRQTISKEYFLELMEYLNENKISINQDDDLLYTEIVIISLWAIVFALQSDEKIDIEFLDIFIEKHIEESKKSFDIEKEKIEAMKYTNNLITDRFKLYFEKWDKVSGGQQTILSQEMLECMGIQKERLLDALLLSHINTWILKTMKRALDFRQNYKIVN